MKVRTKKNHSLGWSDKFNVHGMGEMIVGFDEGDMSSDFINEYEAFIEALNEWKCMKQAFKDHDIISDNYNTTFFEPQCEEDRKRGYTLY